LSSAKRRPAVVISSAIYHEVRQDALILAITSQGGSQAALDTPISAWKQAGLLKLSFLKPAIATVQRELILAKLGRLSGEDVSSLGKLLERMLGCQLGR
jgi:mRNA interferase MazF